MAKINGIATYPENQKTVNTYDRNKQAFSDLLAIAGKDKEYEIVKWALSVSMFRHHALRHRKVIRSIMEPIERLAVRVRMPDNTEEHALAYFNEHIDTRKKEVAQCLQICFLVMVGEMKMTLEFSGGSPNLTERASWLSFPRYKRLRSCNAEFITQSWCTGTCPKQSVTRR